MKLNELAKRKFKDILKDLEKDKGVESAKPLTDQDVEALARKKKREDELKQVRPPEILPGGPERSKI